MTKWLKVEGKNMIVINKGFNDNEPITFYSVYNCDSTLGMITEDFLDKEEAVICAKNKISTMKNRLSKLN